MENVDAIPTDIDFIDIFIVCSVLHDCMLGNMRLVLVDSEKPSRMLKCSLKLD